ncbi:hypothetical protein D3C87_1748450 [compost metagenome]
MPWIDTAPHVPKCLAANLAHARNERLWVDGFGNGVTPGQRVERAEIVRRKGNCATRARIAEAMRKGRQRRTAGMPDAVDILEPGQIIALRRRRDQVATPL